MSDMLPSPPRWAEVFLRVVLRRSDSESIPGDLLEEYREVRRPSLGRLRADVWYITHVLSVLWRATCPPIVAIAALRIISFPLPSGWNPSLVPAPGVSLLDALTFVYAGYYGTRRTGRLSTGIVTAGAASFVGSVMFFVYAAITAPRLLMAPFQTPFVLVIMSILLLMAVAFGIAWGTVGAAMGWWLPSARKARVS